MAQPTRRDFLKSSVAAAVLSGLTGVAQTGKRSATDWVMLEQVERQSDPARLWNRHSRRPSAA